MFLLQKHKRVISLCTSHSFIRKKSKKIKQRPGRRCSQDAVDNQVGHGSLWQGVQGYGRRREQRRTALRLWWLRQGLAVCGHRRPEMAAVPYHGSPAIFFLPRLHREEGHGRCLNFFDFLRMKLCEVHKEMTLLCFCSRNICQIKSPTRFFV